MLRNLLDTGGRGRVNPLYCGHCDQTCGPSDDDPCIEGLPGVMNACCGHGEPEDAYIQFSLTRRIGGQEAFDKMQEWAPTPKGGGDAR